MAIQPVVLQPGVQLTGAATIVYQTPANVTAIAKRVTFTNTDTAARTVTVYRVPKSGAPGATNIIIDAYPLSAGQDYSPIALSGLVLAAGESLQALADVTAKVNCFASGYTTA